MRFRSPRIAPVLAALAVLILVPLAGCDLLSGGSAGTTDTDDESDAVRVTLSWGEQVDLDLEIWDEDGEEHVASASWFESDDVDDGSSEEYFVFERHDGEDFGDGDYVVSVLYAGRADDVDIPSLSVTLEVERADGRSEVRNGTARWDVEEAQWHAFAIDGATGEITDVNEHVGVTSAD